MANAFISGRRYPTGGGAAIPAGHQSYTANGTFTAPYTGVYTVVLTAGHAASGAGARGGNVVTGNNAWGAPGGGGGAGGSAYRSTSPGIIQVMLSQGQVVSVTINNSICSFGNYASFSTGTSPGAGSMGGSATGGGSTSNPGVPGKGGKGGNGGGKPTFSHSNTLYAILPNLPDADLSGGDGGEGEDGKNNGSGKGGKAGVASNSIYGVTGQNGGYGISTDDRKIWDVGYIPIGSTIPAAAGRIDITWGNQ